MRRIIWILINDNIGLGRAVKNKIVLAVFLILQIAKHTGLCFFLRTQNKFHAPWRPHPIHLDFLNSFLSYVTVWSSTGYRLDCGNDFIKSHGSRYSILNKLGIESFPSANCSKNLYLSFEG